MAAVRLEARRVWPAARGRRGENGRPRRDCRRARDHRYRSTIRRGFDELKEPDLPEGRVRREGGGRQAVADVDPTLVADFERIVEPATMGDPERVLKWVSKSPAKLADALRAQGHEVSPNRSPSFSRKGSVTRGRSIARHTKAQATPIATPSSSTSTSGWSLQSPPASR
jgi:hypothetical protein